jgi:hypothetical protein
VWLITSSHISVLWLLKLVAHSLFVLSLVFVPFLQFFETLSWLLPHYPFQHFLIFIMQLPKLLFSLIYVHLAEVKIYLGNVCRHLLPRIPRCKIYFIQPIRIFASLFSERLSVHDVFYFVEELTVLMLNNSIFTKLLIFLPTFLNINHMPFATKIDLVINCFYVVFVFLVVVVVTNSINQFARPLIQYVWYLWGFHFIFKLYFA